ncbi:MAG: alpha/beta fold hydrolase [Polyangiaceae bacterium]|nr:alpha/beta fold hydrolase [Polyangiaceae bacterium]
MNEVHWIGAVDGLELGATLFHPTRAARGTVIVNGATGVPASYYSSFAEHLAASGLRVVTYDYRGVGASRPDSLRGFSATMSDWAELDARSVLGHVRERFGDSPLFWLGHSFGGQALGLIDDAREVTGAVLVGSQLGDLSFWPLPDRLKLSVLLGGLLPAVTRGFGYLPGAIGVGEDLPKGVAEEWARWCLTRGYFLEAHPVARRRFARFDKPTLLYSMSDDDFAPEPAVAQLMALLSSAPLEHRRVIPSELGVEAIGHFGFFRPRFTDTLWREVRWFFDDLIDGQRGFRPRRARAPWNLDDEDVALDLAYGRA